MMEKIEVGKLHPFGTIPSEGCTLAIRQGLIMLMVLPGITKSERENFDHLLNYGELQKSICTKVLMTLKIIRRSLCSVYTASEARED